jgi:hypothetical protein
MMKVSRVLDSPEANIALFGVLLNFPWEMWQAPLYAGMAEASHLTALVRCSLATMGDAAILLAAFWIASAAARSRFWFRQPHWRVLALFVGAGLAISVLIEWLATSADLPGWSWRYSAAMPVIPLIGAGLAPLAQWIAVPLATIWFVRRQLS